MPRADDLPSFKVATPVTPCTHNPLGVKGCGEAGRDRLAAGGHQRGDRRAGRARTSPMPATAERVWRAANKIA